MGKDLRGKRKAKRSKKLQEVKRWLADAIYINEHSDMKWIHFFSRKGEPVKNSTYDTMLFKICEKAEISKFSMHILRHTFATRCIEGGMMLKTLQKILGHSNIGITMNLYVHITEDEKQKEISKVFYASNVG